MRATRVGVVVNPKVGKAYLERLLTALQKHGVKADRVSEPVEERIVDVRPDLVFVLGGDGTMLRAFRMYPGRVLLGVNLGKVGFMSGMLPEHTEIGVQKVLNGELHVQEYRMLGVRIEGEDELLLAANYAVLLKPHPR